MKNYITLFILVSILSSSCEKEPGEDYTLKYYGDALEDIGYSVAITSDGYLIAGQYNKIVRDNGIIDNELSNKNLAAIKTDWGGNIKWKVTGGGKYSDWGKKIYQLEDGSIICVGTLTDTIMKSHGTDIYIVKISASGEKLWEKAWGGAGNQTGIDIVQTSDGFIVLGTSDTYSPPDPPFAGNVQGMLDFYLLKINDSGDSLGHLQRGNSNNDIPAAIKNDAVGSFIFLGTSEKAGTDGKVQNDLIMLKINSDLGIIRVGTMGNETDEYAADMEIQQNGYLIAGTIGKETDIQEAFVRFVKQDLQSSQENQLKFKIRNTSTSVKAISRYGTDQYVMVGLSGSGSAGDMLIFITDASGNPVADKDKITGSMGLQAAYDVACGDDGYIIVVGKNSYDYNSLITLLKFRF